MEPNHFEALRARLEEQLRADVELLYEAHRVKLRAVETVWRAQVDLAQTPPSPGAVERLPVLTLPAGPAATAPADAPPTVRRTEGWSVLFAIQEKMAQIPEVFDKNDVIRALEFAPKRATLFRALDELRSDGWIADESPSEGRKPARYRKL